MKGRIMVAPSYESQYDALGRFNREVCAQFERRGFRLITNYDFDNADFLFYFNAMDMNAELLADFERFDFPVFDFLVDKPEMHLHPIVNGTTNTVFGMVDKKHADVFMRCLPMNNRSVFMPHGGSESALRGGGSSAERDIDVLFCGGYVAEDDAIKTFNRLDSHLAKTDEDYPKLVQLAEMFMRDAALSPYDYINALLRQNSVPARTEQFLSLFRRLSFSVEIMRQRCRDETIKRLCDAGLTVTVYGNNWQAFDYFNHPNFNYKGVCGYDETVDLMTRAKIALNVSPMYRHGGHERLFTAMLNGAACLSTATCAFPDIIDGENVLFYDMAGFDKTVESVKDLLANEPRRRRITEAAYATADKAHRWAHRADAILDVMGFGDAPRL